jgi:hypothetical protein
MELGEQEVATIREAIDKRVENAQEIAMQTLWKRLHTVVEHMAERLHAYTTDPDTGKVKGKFHDTLVSNVRDVCDLIPNLNIQDDGKLEAIRQQIAKDLAKLEPQELRDNDDQRAEAATKATQIADQMSAIMGSTD